MRVRKVVPGFVPTGVEGRLIGFSTARGILFVSVEWSDPYAARQAPIENVEPMDDESRAAFATAILENEL